MAFKEINYPQKGISFKTKRILIREEVLLWWTETKFKKKKKNLTEAWISQWNSVLCYYCKIKIKQILTNQKREVTLILPPFLNLLKCTLYGLPGHYYQDFLKIDFKRICNISIISSVTRRIQKHCLVSMMEIENNNFLKEIQCEVYERNKKIAVVAKIIISYPFAGYLFT